MMPNLVDEHCVIDILDCASDYEKSLGLLDEMDRSVVQRLKEAASGLSKIAGKKQKHKCDANP